jgi:hypothetical protein
MEQNGTPAGEEQLILALAAGATVREAAEQAGIGERTAHRRLADADFRRAVSEARGRLAGLASKATHAPRLSSTRFYRSSLRDDAIKPLRSDPFFLR